MSNEDILKGRWHELKGKIQEKWGELTDDDIDQVQGQREQLIGKLQRAYGYGRQDAMSELDSFLDDLAKDKDADKSTSE